MPNSQPKTQNEERLEQKLQQLADLIADRIWTDYQNGVLKSTPKIPNLSMGKIYSAPTEHNNYESR